MQNRYTTDLREKVEKVKDQDQVLEMLASEVGSEIDKFQGLQSSNTKEECSVCGDKGKLGVLCSERHFVCSACSLACYLSVSTQKPMRMWAKDAQQNFSGLLPSGSVECTKDSCFAFFLSGIFGEVSSVLDLYEGENMENQIHTALHAFQQPLHEGQNTVFNSKFCPQGM